VISGRRGIACAAGFAGIVLAFALEPADAGANPEVALAQRIFADFGVAAELEAASGEALAYLATHRQQVAPADVPRLRAAVSAGFRPASLRAVGFDAFLERYDPQHAAVATRWMARPEARRLIAAGRDVVRYDACLREVTLGAFEPADGAEREALVAKIDRETSAAARARRRASLLFASLLVAGNEALPDLRRFPPAEIDRLLAAQRTETARARSPDRRALHCVYRDVSTAALRDAAVFLDSEAGHWLCDAAEAALERALVRAAAFFARRIVEEFEPGSDPPAGLRATNTGDGGGARREASGGEVPSTLTRGLARALL